MELQWCFRRASFMQGQGTAHAHGMPCNTGRVERSRGAVFKCFKCTWLRADAGEGEVRVSEERGEGRAQAWASAALVEA